MTASPHLYGSWLNEDGLVCPVCHRRFATGQSVIDRWGGTLVHFPDCPRSEIPPPDEGPLTPTRGAVVPNTLTDRAPAGLRAFSILRRSDSSGVSGTGRVLEGCVFSTGAVVVHWLTPAPKGSINVFDSWAQFVEIHLASHPENLAEVHWADGPVWDHDEIAGRSPFERTADDGLVRKES